jgi:hypothetical protein
MLLACLAALFSVAAGVPYEITGALAAPVPSMQKYLGYWNYDQPNLTTLNNVAVLACPGGGGQCDPQLPLPLKVPQVGWVLFSPGPNGTVNGRTDQGCTWNFKVTPTDLELSSTTQQCFNHAVGSVGNIIKWSVTVTGNHEHEQIVAVSHQPNGVDLIGTMKSGSRTRVDGSGGAKSFSRFLGGYTYNPADFTTLTNVVVTDKGTAYPSREPSGSPERTAARSWPTPPTAAAGHSPSGATPPNSTRPHRHATWPTARPHFATGR